MKVESTGHTLKITDLDELNVTNAIAFRAQARAAIAPEHHEVIVDCSTTRLLDSSGLGALISVNKVMLNRQGHVRIVNPTPAVTQVLEFAHLRGLFMVSQS